jgi:hypothetical protein
MKSQASVRRLSSGGDGRGAMTSATVSVRVAVGFENRLEHEILRRSSYRCLTERTK